MKNQVKPTQKSQPPGFQHIFHAQDQLKVSSRSDIRAGNPIWPILWSTSTIDCVHRY